MPLTASQSILPASLLAELPATGGYFSIIKIILFLLCLLLWANNSTWVQADTKKVRVPQGLWVSWVFGGGGLGLLVWMLIPLYMVGFVAFVLIYGSAIITYVIFRNKHVPPAQTMLTIAHFQRMTTGKSTKETSEVGKERTRIKDANGKTPPWPTDPDASAGYQATQDLLFDAIWSRSSDVRMDLLPGQPVTVVYRVDGVDRAREPIDAAMGPWVFTHLRRIAGLNTEEIRKPQIGKFTASIGAGGKGDKKVDVQVKSSGSTSGQRIILKVFAEEGKFRLPDVGFTKTQLPVAEQLLKEPRGLIVISGPRASGVTSTMYAFLRGHDAFQQNIHTLEVAKAGDLENISQHVFDNSDGSVTFGKRFRSLLRTEPDTVMAGDTPDAETAQLGAQAAKHGKKIYLGMAAKDTFEALRIYIQFVQDNALAAQALLAIVNQRLVRVLCANCRRGYKPDPALLKKANLPTGDNHPFYRPPNPTEVETDKQGNPILCPVCQGSGYLGRTGVFEILLMDDELRAKIASGGSLSEFKASARKRGMLYLQEVALHKVYEGATSINEVLRVTQDKAAAPAAAKVS